MRILRQPIFWVAVLWAATFVVLLVKTVPVSGDGIYYYAWLRSSVVDGDVDFKNDLEFFRANPYVAKQLDSGVTTPAGLTPNLFSVGPALFWAPVWLPMHWLSGGNGFSAVELLAPGIATGLYGLAGLLLTYAWLRKILSKVKSFSPSWLGMAVMLGLLGTNLVYYLVFETSLAHGIGFFIVSLLLFLWWRCRDQLLVAKTVWWQGLLLGLVAGLAGTVRWQLLAVALVVPGVDVVVTFFRALSAKERVNLSEAVRQLAAVFLGIAVGFAPQMLGWKFLYGDWLAVPQGEGFLNWQSPHFFEVLFSGRHGWLSWTPLVILGLFGLILALRRISAARYALAIILGQIFINGAALEWWGGDAYGARRFTDIAAVLILGLALLFWRVQHRWLRYSLLALCSLIVLGNLALMQVYRLDLIPRDQTLLR